MPYASPVFSAKETNGVALRATSHVIAQSEDLGWSSMYAAIVKTGPYEGPTPTVHHPTMSFHLGQPAQLTRELDGFPKDHGAVGPRQFCLTPANAVSRWQYTCQPTFLTIHVRQPVFEAAVQELYGFDGAIEVTPSFAITDPLLEQMALSVVSALQEEKFGNGLYIDTLAQMIAAHLLFKHSNRSRAMRRRVGTQAPHWKMQRVVDFIEHNLDRDLSLKVLAEVAEVSCLYLPRVFRQSLGHPVHRYLLDRRIERAAQLLRDTELPISDVASRTGFSSPSHLAKWFVRKTGVPPATYRRPC